MFPLQIDPNISPEELLGHVTSDQPEPTRKYLLVGLHTCGDLAPTILRLFAKSDSVVGVVSVGCCYMKVTCLSCDQPPAPNIPTCECDMAATCVHTCAAKDPRGELIVCRLGGLGTRVTIRPLFSAARLPNEWEDHVFAFSLSLLRSKGDGLPCIGSLCGEVGRQVWHLGGIT